MKQLVSILVISLYLLVTAVTSELYIPWTDDNCNTNGTSEDVVWGHVTDAICCSVPAPESDPVTACRNDETCNSLLAACGNDKSCIKKVSAKATRRRQTSFARYCAELDTQARCDNEDRCIWKYAALETGIEGQCKPNRDAVNNVCCRPEDIQENCMKVLNGECPQSWRIPSQCCPYPYTKYVNILETGSDDLVCCNAPCSAIEKAWAGNSSAGIAGDPSCTADLSPNCAPQQRSSLSSLQMFGGNNMNPYLMSKLLNFPVSSDMKPGQSNSYLDTVDNMLSGDMGNMMSLMNKVSGQEENYVEEITVDDFISALIDALDNDNDVFEYKSDTLSTKFGKQTVSGFNPFKGGMLGLMMAMMGMGSYTGFSFPNAYNNYINPMYNSYSPYSYPMAQYQYGMTFGYNQNAFSSPQDPYTMPGMEQYSPYAFEQKYGSVVNQQQYDQQSQQQNVAPPSNQPSYSYPQIQQPSYSYPYGQQSYSYPYYQPSSYYGGYNAGGNFNQVNEASSP